MKMLNYSTDQINQILDSLNKLNYIGITNASLVIRIVQVLQNPIKEEVKKDTDNMVL